jgi:hypothetical protein
MNAEQEELFGRGAGTDARRRAVGTHGLIVRHVKVTLTLEVGWRERDLEPVKHALPALNLEL